MEPRIGYIVPAVPLCRCSFSSWPTQRGYGLADLTFAVVAVAERRVQRTKSVGHCRLPAYPKADGRDPQPLSAFSEIKPLELTLALAQLIVGTGSDRPSSAAPGKWR